MMIAPHTFVIYPRLAKRRDGLGFGRFTPRRLVYTVSPIGRDYICLPVETNGLSGRM